MQLRHISPRSIDWLDAMDEDGGGRGWERLGPEEQAKLLRQKRDDGETVSGDGASGYGASGYGSRRPARPSGYFATASPSR
jgi:hypothetical protein